MLKKTSISFWILLLAVSCGRGRTDALESACRIADRLLADTSFELKEVSLGKDSSYRKLVIPEDAAFRKHPFGEWHYANGATLTGLQYLADITGRDDYR